MKKKLTGVAAGTVCAVSVIIGIITSHRETYKVRTSEAGLELIGNAEGCRRDPYNCPAGYLTDGIGNTHGVKPGTHKTDEQIARDWAANIREAESCVNQFASGASLPQGVFDSATELTFNTGCPAMQKSTFFKLLRAGDYPAACGQLPRWVYAGGQKLPGLVTRRAKSRALCLSGSNE